MLHLPLPRCGPFPHYTPSSGWAGVSLPCAESLVH